MKKVKTLQEIHKDLKEALRNYLKPSSKEKGLQNFEKTIRAYINKRIMKNSEEHIQIKIVATPEQMREGELSVELLSLDNTGAELIRKMRDNSND